MKTNDPYRFTADSVESLIAIAIRDSVMAAGRGTPMRYELMDMKGWAGVPVDQRWQLVQRSAWRYDRHVRRVTLPVEIGDALNKAWTRGKYGSRSGTMTMRGICEKLLKTGSLASMIKKGVKEAEERAAHVQKIGASRDMVSGIDAFLNRCVDEKGPNAKAAAKLPAEIVAVLLACRDANAAFIAETK